MSNSNPPSTGSHGCSFFLLNLLLGLCFTFGTVIYQRDPEPMCGGGLSAGFPLAFICDDTGGSPISSWGKIDFVDLFHVSLRLFLLDFLLDSALLTLGWIVIAGILRKGLAQVEVFRWAILLCMGYIVVFLFAFILFQSNTLNFEPPRPTTPTPIVFTPTPFGTPPFPEVPPTAGL